MELLLSAMLVRRTEREDSSTSQLEHRSVSEWLAKGVCAKAVASQRPGDGAIPCERSELGIV
ncbi:MAG: hypothetical protein ACI3ZZ_05250 [Candidatus Aphodosoma sp.]